MDGRGWMARHGFWPLPAPTRSGSLLWLPAGVVAQAAVRFGWFPEAFAIPGELLAAGGSLAPASLCGLPLPAPDPDPRAAGCCRLRRLGYRRAAWAAGVGLGVMTVAATVFAGPLGPAAVAT